jgi:hypothetical protein
MMLGDVPTDTVEQAEMLKLIAHATRSIANNPHYTYLRKLFMDVAELSRLLPPLSERAGRLIHSGRTSKVRRRKIIGTAFTPLIDQHEGHNRAPGDIVVSDALQTFDAEEVYAVWAKESAQRGPRASSTPLACDVVHC